MSRGNGKKITYHPSKSINLEMFQSFKKFEDLDSLRRWSERASEDLQCQEVEFSQVSRTVGSCCLLHFPSILETMVLHRRYRAAIEPFHSGRWWNVDILLSVGSRKQSGLQITRNGRWWREWEQGGAFHESYLENGGVFFVLFFKKNWMYAGWHSLHEEIAYHPTKTRLWVMDSEYKSSRLITILVEVSHIV